MALALSYVVGFYDAITRVPVQKPTVVCDGPALRLFPHRWDHIYFPNWNEFQRHALQFGVTDFDVGLRFLREDAPAGRPSCVVAEELGAAEPFEAESCESPLIKAIKDYTA